MAKEVYVLGDIGATNSRVTVMNGKFESLGSEVIDTLPGDYETSMQNVVDTAERLLDGRGQVVAATMGIAGAVDKNGILTQAGALSPWIGKRPAAALEDGLNLGPGRAAVHNDMVVVAISQQEINWSNKSFLDGNVVTLSSGFGGALYAGDGSWYAGDEPGHEYLRDGAVCPCGKHGHAEAFISGKGVLANHGVDMAQWLGNLGNARTFVTDVSDTFIAMIERHRSEGIDVRELRWTGGVALGQPFLMQRAVGRIRSHFSSEAPSFGVVTMGDSAGLHGAMVDAQKRALAA